MPVSAANSPFINSVLFPEATPASGFEWQGESDADDMGDISMGSYTEGWFISYIDILTLLLTLFVILLAMSEPKSDVTVLHRQPIIETASAKQTSQPAPSPVAKLATSGKAIQAETSDITKSDQVKNPDPTQTEVSQAHETKRLLPAADSRQQSLPYGISDTAQFRTLKDTIDIFPLASLSTGQDEQTADHDATADTAKEPVTGQASTTDAIASDKDGGNPWLEQIRHSALGQRIDIVEAKDHVDLVISDHILFAPGHADIKAAGLELLGQLAAMIKDSKLHVSIEGHTDNVPIHNAQFPSNWELSTARATIVTRYLIENSIAPDRIRAIGYADTHPRAQNDSVQGRARNRRVAIVLHLPDTPAPANVASRMPAPTGG